MRYIVYFHSSWNSVIVSVSDGEKPLFYGSSKLELSSHKLHNEELARNLAKGCIQSLLSHGITKVPMVVKGPGNVRGVFVQEFLNSEVELAYIKDMTPIPHNGCRPPKRHPLLRNLNKVKVLTMEEPNNEKSQ